MRKYSYFFIVSSYLFLFSVVSLAQSPASVKHGPSGIFIFLGKEIPSGKTISAYKIERSEDKVNWMQLAEVQTPSSFDAFSKAVNQAKAFFPAQPIPPADKLGQLYLKAVSTGSADSLKGFRMLFPIRVALGIMFYDTTAKKNITYSYRINEVKTSGILARTFLSDTISLPLREVFDTITYRESSYNTNSVLIKWMSVGKKPAPLFMVYKFRYGAPVVAKGKTSQYNVNDTTYYVYYDTTVAKEAGKEMQFFVSPFDHFGNAGMSSQAAVISQDNFNRAGFVRNHTEFMAKLSGVQVCWHFTDPVTVKTIEIYKSEKPDAGFRKIAEATSYDTSYLDQQIWPEKSYYYYVQAVAKAGRRTRQTEIMMAVVPGLFKEEKLNAPILKQVTVVNSNIRLIIEVSDSAATHIRVYRGVKGGLIALPALAEINNASVVSFTDSTLRAEDMKDVFYAVRNERNGTKISGLSAELPVSMITDLNEVAYFYAFLSNGKMELYWDDVINRQSEYSAYMLARQNGPANSKTPLKIIAENIKNCNFTDDSVQEGNQYTYVLHLIDKAGEISEKLFVVTTP